jgi:hypothetical protein
VSEDETIVDAEIAAEPREEKKKLLPFFPNYVLDEVIAWYVMLAVLVILASVFPAGLEEPADPLRNTPNPSGISSFFTRDLRLCRASWA